MKKYASFIVILAMFSFPVLCLANEAIPGPYISGFVGVHAPADTNASSTDFISEKSYYDRVEFDPGTNIGGTGGYDFGLVRLEGELSHKYAAINSIANQVPGERFHNAVGELGVLAMMFNGFVNLYNTSPVTPYLGGGIGFAAIHLSDTDGIRIVGGTAQRVLLYGAGDDTVFAYQVGGGMDIVLNRRFSLDIGYRYFRANRANIDSDQAILTSMEFKSHSTAIGFKYRY